MSQPIAEFATLTADDLVTGEAVALDLPPAGLGIRLASGLVDVVVTMLLLLGLAFVLFIAVSRADGALQGVAFVGLSIAVFIVAPTTFETVTRGRSPGKLLTGLRTVRDDGGPISFQHAFVRALVGFVEIYVFGGAPAFFSALVSPRAKRLGDHAAGTYVVRERVRLVLPQPVEMPPELRSWAMSADIAPLPTALALGVRQLLTRTHQITPEAYAAVSVRLADQVLPLVAPRPPTGTPADRFLAAVVAARREIDAARLERESALRQRLTGSR